MNQNRRLETVIVKLSMYLVTYVTDDRLTCLQQAAMHDSIHHQESYSRPYNHKPIMHFFCLARHFLCHRWFTHKESFVYQTLKKSETSRQECGRLRKQLVGEGGCSGKMAPPLLGLSCIYVVLKYHHFN